MTRTDPHRPGAIIPTDYVHVLWYACATTVNGWPQLSVNVDRIVELRRDPAVRWAPTGSTGKCSVCGACFIYGEVWRHVPTGEHVHVGHECADKYNMLADRSEWEAWHREQKDLRATAVQARARAEARDAFLDSRPELAAALALGTMAAAVHPGAEREPHNVSPGQVDPGCPECVRLGLQQQRPGRREDARRILADMGRKLLRFGSLSDKQAAFALRLAEQVQAPDPEPERHVPAPIGRVTVRGRVVSVKTHEGNFGTMLKMTVKVETPDGSWLVWTTVPAQLDSTDIRGKTVEFTATLEPGREPHFAFGKRPTKARVVESKT